MPSRYFADAFDVIAKKYSAFPSLQPLYNEARKRNFSLLLLLPHKHFPEPSGHCVGRKGAASFG
jgi:hypothetical protein